MRVQRLIVAVGFGLGLLAVAPSGRAGEVVDPVIQRLAHAIQSLVNTTHALQKQIDALKENIGPRVLVHDARGTLVGVLLGNQGHVTESGFQVAYETLEVYDVTNDVVVRLDALTGAAISDHNFAVKFLLFPSSDCTGQAYVSNANGTAFESVLNNPYMLVSRLISDGPEEHYAGNKDIGAAENVGINSRLLPDNTCQPHAEIYPLVTAVDPIILNYSGPLTISAD